MMTKTIEKKDYLGNKICKGQKEDKSCPKFDVNSGKGALMTGTVIQEWIGKRT